MYLSNGNKKLKSNAEVKFLIWNLPAMITCPNATEHCKKFCYARKAERVYPQVLPCRMKNLEDSKKESFTAEMSAEIAKNSKTKKKVFFRIHESGDFYSQSYFDKWIDIATAFPHIVFLAYTKSVKYVYETKKHIPDNFVIRFSLWDDTKAEDARIAELLNLPTYTADRLTAEQVEGLKAKNAFCECKDCATCALCYSNDNKSITCEIH